MRLLSGLQGDVRERVDAALAAAEAAGLVVHVTSTYRDPKLQKRLYDAWIRRGRTGLPAAPPGRSTHEYGLAFDAVVTRGRLQDFVRIAECHGLKWAGQRDRVHFDPFGFEAWSRLLSGKAYSVSYGC
jgi:LAS superfamily LD-carboxypeptidase LdcB